MSFYQAAIGFQGSSEGSDCADEPIKAAMSQATKSLSQFRITRQGIFSWMLGATRDDILNEPCLQARFQGGPAPLDLERAHPFSDALFQNRVHAWLLCGRDGMEIKKGGEAAQPRSPRLPFGSGYCPIQRVNGSLSHPYKDKDGITFG